MSIGVPSAIFNWYEADCTNDLTQSATVTAGDASTWEFRQLQPVQVLTGRTFEVRVNFTTPLIMTMAGSKVTTDANGTVIAEPLASDTISQRGTYTVELWETTVATPVVLPKRILSCRIKFIAPAA